MRKLLILGAQLALCGVLGAQTQADLAGQVQGVLQPLNGGQSGSVILGNYESLTAAVADCPVSATPCKLITNTHVVVPASVTLPSNVVPEFWSNGSWTLNSGVVVTVGSGKIIAPDIQVFYGTGTLANLTYVLPGWFGGSMYFEALANMLQDVTGATIGPWLGTVNTTGAGLTRAHLTVKGFGMLPYTSDHTAFQGPGSIIGGVIHLDVPDLHLDGINSDMGSYRAAHGGSCTYDSSGNLLIVTPAGGVKSNITLRNVATLGCSSTTAAHSILIQGYDGVTVEHIRTWFNTRGFISKSSGVYGADIESHEMAGECFIVKSDATEGGIAISRNRFYGVRCINDSPTTGGTAQVYAAFLPLTDLSIDGLEMVNMGELYIYGYGAGSALANINLTNFYSSGSVARGITLGAVNGQINIVNPVILSPASDGIWFVGGPVNITNPTIINPGSGYGIAEVNGGNGTVTGGGCSGASTACVYAVHGPLYVSNMYNASGPALVLGPGIGYLTTPYTPNGNFSVGTPDDLTSYYFGGGDVRQDKGIAVSGFNTAQINLRNTGSGMANQHNFQAVLDESGFSFSFMNDARTAALHFFGCNRSGYTATSCTMSAPLTLPSILPANGVSSTVVVGACTLTYTSGILTATSGC